MAERYELTRRALTNAAMATGAAIGTWADNSKIAIGFTPKFLKDDFQTLTCGPTA